MTTKTLKAPTITRHPTPANADKIFVYNGDVLEEVVDNSSSRLYNTIRLDKTPKVEIKSHLHRTDLDRNTIREAAAREDERTKRLIQEGIEKDKRRKDRNFQTLMNVVDSTQKEIIDVEKSIEKYDFARERQVRQLFEEWNEGVHGTIQRKIAKQIDSMSSKELHERKLADYNKFLSVTNKKANIFRDIIIESEYDPLEPNRRAIKAKLNKNVRDPTFINQQKAKMEANMLKLSDDELDKAPSGGRLTLPVTLWAAEKIESTSFGFSRPPYEKQIQPRKVVDRSHSSVSFNDFDFPRGKEVVNAEMPRGKRVFS